MGLQRVRFDCAGKHDILRTQGHQKFQKEFKMIGFGCLKIEVIIVLNFDVNYMVGYQVGLRRVIKTIYKMYKLAYVKSSKSIDKNKISHTES